LLADPSRRGISGVDRGVSDHDDFVLAPFGKRCATEIFRHGSDICAKDEHTFDRVHRRSQCGRNVVSLRNIVMNVVNESRASKTPVQNRSRHCLDIGGVDKGRFEPP
jgi:hypothetical protein